MLTRIENLSKKKDMERLKQMTAVAGADEDSGTSKRKRRGEKKKTEKKPKAPSPVKVYTSILNRILFMIRFLFLTHRSMPRVVKRNVMLMTRRMILKTKKVLRKMMKVRQEVVR